MDHEDTDHRAAPGRADDTRDHVLDAAGRLFREQGYSGTSMKTIAAAVGISAPALYWHFASKTDLLHSVLEKILNDFWQRLSGQVHAAGEDPVTRLDAFVTTYVGIQLRERESATTFTQLFDVGHMVANLSDEQQESLYTVSRSTVNLLRGILEAGAGQRTFQLENVTVTAFAILSMCEHVHTWYRPEGHLSIDDVAHHYAHLAQAMVRQPCAANGSAIPAQTAHTPTGTTTPAGTRHYPDVGQSRVHR